MRLLSLVTALTLAAAAQGIAAKRPRLPPPPPPPPVTLVHANTHEHYKLQPDKRGRFGLKGWNRFLRCHHTQRRHAMATRLANLIYQAAQHFDVKRAVVVAGYRHPKVARKKGNPRSPHQHGHAVDFRLEGVPNTELRDYVRTLDNVGVGYYPNSHHIHIDVRRGKAFWIDYSTDGQRALYSKNPDLDLAVEGAEKSPPQESVKAMQEGALGPEVAAKPGAPAPNTPALAPVTP